MKAKLGMRKVRPWKWMPFTNPARRDNLILYHWRRQADEGKEYAFARFNKRLEMPTFSDIEYQNHLTAEGKLILIHYIEKKQGNFLFVLGALRTMHCILYFLKAGQELNQNIYWISVAVLI